MSAPEIDLAERVRSALIEAALSAYTDAGVRGLCCEGAWEAAVAALRRLELEPLCRSAPQADAPQADAPQPAAPQPAAPQADAGGRLRG